MLPDVRANDFVRCRRPNGETVTGVVHEVTCWDRELLVHVFVIGFVVGPPTPFYPQDVEVLYCADSARHQALMQIEAQHQLAEAIRGLKLGDVSMAEKEEKIKKTGVVNRNKEAAVQAATLEAGKIALHRTRDLVAGSLPSSAHGFLDTPLGALAVANLLDGLAGMAMPEESPWRKVTGASLTAAYSEAIGVLNLDEITKSIFAGINLPGAH